MIRIYIIQSTTKETNSYNMSIHVSNQFILLYEFTQLNGQKNKWIHGIYAFIEKM